tara:strand:- start:325 stop:639 length:315 start_codon:yes stop_codon:yes gene_type:complete
MSKAKKKKKEPKGWLDEPSNIRKIIKGFYWICGLVLLADFIFSIGWHKHEAFGEEFTLHGIETLPAFYGLYGFVACVGLVYVSKSMRDWNGKRTLMREEDYWDH